MLADADAGAALTTLSEIRSPVATLRSIVPVSYSPAAPPAGTLTETAVSTPFLRSVNVSAPVVGCALVVNTTMRALVVSAFVTHVRDASTVLKPAPAIPANVVVAAATVTLGCESA